MARTLRSDEQLKETLASARTVAVLGAHPDPARPAHFVPAYLHEHGYRVIGVNAMHAGKKLWGEDVAPSVDALATPIDVLVIFRRAEVV